VDWRRRVQTALFESLVAGLIFFVLATVEHEDGALLRRLLLAFVFAAVNFVVWLYLAPRFAARKVN
jgi:hypothetical protein